MSLQAPSLVTVQKDIRCRIDNILKPLLNDIKIQHDDAPFDKPNNVQWLRATIRIPDAGNADIGTVRKRIRTIGILIFNIFTPLTLGDLETNQIADEIHNVFSSKSSGQIVYRAATTGERRRLNDSWMVNVQCPFFADQIEE